jgi:uncharacterized protein YyaL (SSP411 family)
MPHPPRYLVLFLLLIAVLPAAADQPGDPPKEKHVNRLARESSPYLLQHAHNPVDWYPWGDEAFAKAKKEGKLVFLSIGYSSCHWCHVMERESFANEEVAKILNDNFVCIKVDREERPDVDHVYMTALQAMEQPGGWPLSMFLTADAKPIVGGTYWPREDREIEGRKVRGFKSLLKAMSEAQKQDADGIREHADKMAKQTADLLAGAARGLALIDLDRELVNGAVDGLKETFDREHGGFGSPQRQFKGAKFPMPPPLRLLQHEAARRKDRELDGMVRLTLEKMALGGIYDHVGGGFHRYSTERTWTVPHFEKMLYDNAQLLEIYARAFRETKSPLYRGVLEETLAFVRRELTSPDGAFYSAIDADSEGEEGKFYVWTPKQVKEALGDGEDARSFRRLYGLEDAPNFEGQYYILRLKEPLGERAAAMAGLKAKLLAVRAKRPRPFLDVKVLTAWNGQMIAGQALAGQALGDKKAVEAAVRAAEFVLKNLRTRDGRLLRSWGAAPGQPPRARLNGYLDDYAFLVHGLLCLHDVTGDDRWLTEAKALAEQMIQWHLDKDVGAFFYTSSDHEKLFARAKDQFDGAQPSGNSVAARDLVRLWIKTGDERYAKLAEKTVRALAAPLKTNPTGLTTLAEALALYLDAREKEK